MNVRNLYVPEGVESPFVFPNSRGGQATKLSPGIKTLTQKYLGVEVPVSKFRYFNF